MKLCILILRVTTLCILILRVTKLCILILRVTKLCIFCLFKDTKGVIEIRHILSNGLSSVDYRVRSMLVSEVYKYVRYSELDEPTGMMKQRAVSAVNETGFIIKTDRTNLRCYFFTTTIHIFIPHNMYTYFWSICYSFQGFS